MSRNAMVVLSGGQDSVTCLFWAKKTFDKVHAITFDYNQRHRIELEAAKKAAALAGVTNHTIVKLGPILNGRSPLTNPEESLETYANAKEMEKIIGERVELTFVPMRNALFLTIAANHAACLDIYDLVTGVCQMDNANYPDCRREFISQQEKTINEALGLNMATPDFDKNPPSFHIHTPLMNLSKADTCKLAIEVGAWEALAYSHTAYAGTYPPTSKDHANILRADGFEKAGLPDPLVLRAWFEQLMELPETSNYDHIRRTFSGHRPHTLEDLLSISRAHSAH